MPGRAGRLRKEKPQVVEHPEREVAQQTGGLGLKVALGRAQCILRVDLAVELDDREQPQQPRPGEDIRPELFGLQALDRIQPPQALRKTLPQEGEYRRVELDIEGSHRVEVVGFQPRLDRLENGLDRCLLVEVDIINQPVARQALKQHAPVLPTDGLFASQPLQQGFGLCQLIGVVKTSVQQVEGILDIARKLLRLKNGVLLPYLQYRGKVGVDSLAVAE